jgi:hypothetical protein
MIVVPVTHDLVHLATVDTARLSLSLLDEVAEERGAWRKRHVVDVAVKGLIHSEHELRHTTTFPQGLLMEEPALGFLGEQHKAHHREETKNKQNLKFFMTSLSI